MEAGISIRRLRAADYDEALDLMNLTFSMMKQPSNFLTSMPRIWGRDDEHMGKHIAVERDGKLRALLGVYPIPVVICGRPLMFSTVGNVATHPYENGKGYMSLLLDEAMKGLDQLGADASRLGGLRQRYARYGYEPIGSQYNFSLTPHNLRARCPEAFHSDIAFRPIGAQDAELLAAAHAMQKTAPMYVERGSDADFYLSLITWQSRPVAAFRGNTMVGYMSVTPSGEGVNECIAQNDAAAFDMLCAWLAQSGKDSLHITVEAWRPALARLLWPLCEGWSASSPCRFYLRSWDRVTEALLALKRTFTALPDGEAILGVRGWGALHIQVSDAQTVAEKTDREPLLWLEPAEAAHLIAGNLPPTSVCELPANLQALLAAWFPLPLSWCTLDRV